MYHFSLVCRHLRLLQPEHLCVLLELTSGREALQDTQSNISVKTKETCKSKLPKAISKGKVISINVCWILSWFFWFVGLGVKSRFYAGNVMPLTSHPLLVWNTAPRGTHRPACISHSTEVGSAVLYNCGESSSSVETAGPVPGLNYRLSWVAQVSWQHFALLVLWTVSMQKNQLIFG